MPSIGKKLKSVIDNGDVFFVWVKSSLESDVKPQTKKHKNQFFTHTAFKVMCLKWRQEGELFKPVIIVKFATASVRSYHGTWR